MRALQTLNKHACFLVPKYGKTSMISKIGRAHTGGIHSHHVVHGTISQVMLFKFDFIVERIRFGFGQITINLLFDSIHSFAAKK